MWWNPNRISKFNSSKTGLIGANGTGTYKFFEVPILASPEVKMVLEQLGTSFDVLGGIEGFNPCKSDIFIILADRFGAESETVTATGPENSTLIVKPEVQLVCEKGFADKKGQPLRIFCYTARRSEGCGRTDVYRL